ncbi:MAG TPA: SDR family NAD(P)-dependent oxidoreductase, partial [Nitriliruptorales bacterium]
MRANRWMRGARGGIDLVVLVAAWVVPFLLRFEFNLPPSGQRQLVVLLPYVVFAQFAALSFLGVERQSWRYISLRESIHITRAIAVVSLVLLAARIVAPGLQSLSPRAAYLATPLSIILMNGALAVGGLLAVRVIRRLQSSYVELRHVDRPHETSRVLLIGAGRAGVLVARELDGRPELGIRPIGFVDDNPRKQGTEVHGIPVIGTTADIQALSESRRIDEAIITIASADGATIRRITAACKDARLPTKIIPGIYEIVGGQVNLERIRPVAIEDLLGRDPVELDTTGIRGLVAHDVVMVTGAGGSIGSELCRQLARFDPRKIVLVEQAENALWAVHRELQDDFPTVEVVPAIADVCDRDRIDHLLLEHRPSVLFHAAAHKHVPMMECNPGEAIKNNVLGTRTVADLALARGVERFVM